MNKWIITFLIFATAQGFCSTTANQTDNLSPILSPDSLPFTITIEQSDFQLPSDSLNGTGIQSFAWGYANNKWLLIAGRTNGLHGFAPPPDSFPPSQQNQVVYVVDPVAKTVVSKSLADVSSHLTQAQIDALSATAVQFHQENNTLYVVGGYGIDTASGQMTTKSTLTAIDVPGFMSWVECTDLSKSAAQYIRQTSHSLLKVTGGFLTKLNPHNPFLLVFGQDFEGVYTDSSNGIYTRQVRPFKVIDNGKDLYIKPEKQFTPNANYCRRDLSVVPIVQKSSNQYVSSFVALSGVFTTNTGVWTVPVLINSDGTSTMPDPSNSSTFKQGMNNYDCARTVMFSKKTGESYILLFGGISYLSYSGGSFVPDPLIPFINSVTTVKIDTQGNFSQYLMENEYPVILSEFSNAGNQLLFGAEARFIPTTNIPLFSNGVFSFDHVGDAPVLLGYIVGGIQSTFGDTNLMSDSAASPYIFSVYVQRR